MTLFSSIFTCNSSKNEEVNNLKRDIETLKTRINNLELSYSSLRDILIEIRLDIKFIRLEMNNKKNNNN